MLQEEGSVSDPIKYICSLSRYLADLAMSVFPSVRLTASRSVRMNAETIKARMLGLGM